MGSSSADAIEQLKEDVRDYQEDLFALTEETGGTLKVQAGSATLSKQLERFINKLEKDAEFEGNRNVLMTEVGALNMFDLDSDGSITTDELRDGLQVQSVERGLAVDAVLAIVNQTLLCPCRISPLKSTKAAYMPL